MSGKHCENRKHCSKEIHHHVSKKIVVVYTTHLEIIMIQSHMTYIVCMVLLELSLAFGVISTVHKIKTKTYPHLNLNISSFKVYP